MRTADAGERMDATSLSDEAGHLRVPPHSVEAEQSVLGSLLLDNRCMEVVAGEVSESDFYRHEHRVIFGAIDALLCANRAADVVSVFQQLQDAEKANSVGGLRYLNELAQCVPGASNAARYAEIVRGKSMLRALIATCDEIATSAFHTQGRDVAEVLDKAGASISALLDSGGKASDWEEMPRLLQQQLETAQSAVEKQSEEGLFIPTGLVDLDNLLDGGMRGGDFIIIGGRPGMGKTALADTIGNYVAMCLGLTVGKSSMEMQNAQNAQRALAWSSRVPMHALRRPKRLSADDWSRMVAASDDWRRVPLFSIDQAALNINQLRSKARALRSRRGLRLLIIDYLQLMSGTDPRAKRHEQLEQASRGIKALAKELDIPIIALAQVNRAVEKESDPMPRMSDLKDCGSLEQDADVILFVHRPCVADPTLDASWKPYAQVRLAKQRGGRAGEDFALHYEGQHTRFSDWPADMETPKKAQAEKAKKGSKL